VNGNLLISKCPNLPSNISSDFGTNAFILQLREKLLHHLPRVLDLNWLLKTSEKKLLKIVVQIGLTTLVHFPSHWLFYESIKERTTKEEHRRQRKGAEKSRRKQATTWRSDDRSLRAEEIHVKKREYFFTWKKKK
jgi:hypothetical protein